MSKRSFLSIGMCLFFLSGSLVFGSQWILDSKSNDLPGDLAAKVSQAGGTLVNTIDELGIAVAEFATREEAEAMEAHGFNVMPDFYEHWLPTEAPATEIIEANIGSDETYYGYQWHLPLIGADKAWDLGITGRGVRVAVLDTGIYYAHPDLNGRVDLTASASFVPGVSSFSDDNGHGSHVAGIIAANDNSYGSIGIAPNATLVSVKVLNSEGSGNYSWIAAGIVHAANQNVQIINMSLGGYIKKNGNEPYYTAKDAAYFVTTRRKAINYAHSKGCLVVVAAGNESVDLDKLGNIIAMSTELGNVIGISATGPIGLQYWDNPASYTNYGHHGIFMAAPGGDYQLYPQPGWHYDMVFSTTNRGWSWSAGTSMAAPMVAGVAALVLEKYGPMSPGELKSHLARTSDDLGKPGKDVWYGHGRVNAYRAVTE